jgi:hypothetical protein
MTEIILAVATAGILSAVIAWYVRGARFAAERASADAQFAVFIR